MKSRIIFKKMEVLPMIQNTILFIRRIIALEYRNAIDRFAYLF